MEQQQLLKAVRFENPVESQRKRHVCVRRELCAECLWAQRPEAGLSVCGTTQACSRDRDRGLESRKVKTTLESQYFFTLDFIGGF